LQAGDSRRITCFRRFAQKVPNVSILTRAKNISRKGASKGKPLETRQRFAPLREKPSGIEVCSDLFSSVSTGVGFELCCLPDVDSTFYFSLK
jgi:hypothetical protein